MKRLISGLLFLCSICVSAQTYTYDVNIDGNVDMADLAFFVNYLKSYTSGTPTYDVNGDGTADITDVTCLKNHILGLFNVGEHEYVDLGLPSGIKWATCNVGADNPEDYGLYFAWGDVTGYSSTEADSHSFVLSKYKWYNSTSKTYTKYVTSSSYGTPDGRMTLDAEDDAACVIWGGHWRMPTFEEINELYNNCVHEWVTQNGVCGLRFTGSNGNTIFLPAAGFRSKKTSQGSATFIAYWSSSLFYSSDPSDNYSYCLECEESNNYQTDERFYGLCIRPVCP